MARAEASWIGGSRRCYAAHEQRDSAIAVLGPRHKGNPVCEVNPKAAATEGEVEGSLIREPGDCLGSVCCQAFLPSPGRRLAFEAPFGEGPPVPAALVRPVVSQPVHARRRQRESRESDDR